jgi:leader peptidase (prepilin peptidase) / N-methyltransferase
MISALQTVNAEFPWFFPCWVGLLGACIGSFLNVCIYRIPKEESVITPRSHCGCGQPIAWYDNIPVLSWSASATRRSSC